MMSFRDRLETAASDEPPRSSGANGASRQAYLAAKKRIHQTLLDRVDLSRLQRLDTDQMGTELKHKVT